MQEKEVNDLLIKSLLYPFTSCTKWGRLPYVRPCVFSEGRAAGSEFVFAHMRSKTLTYSGEICFHHTSLNHYYFNAKYYTSSLLNELFPCLLT